MNLAVNINNRNPLTVENVEVISSYYKKTATVLVLVKVLRGTLFPLQLLI